MHHADARRDRRLAVVDPDRFAVDPDLARIRPGRTRRGSTSTWIFPRRSRRRSRGSYRAAPAGRYPCWPAPRRSSSRCREAQWRAALSPAQAHWTNPTSRATRPSPSRSAKNMPDPSRRVPSLNDERGAGMGVMHHNGTGFQMPLRQAAAGTPSGKLRARPGRSTGSGRCGSA